MKKIHFENIGGNWIMLSILILSLILLVFGNFKLIEFNNPKINNGIRLVGFLIIILYLSRMFWYKNYVQWNKKGIVIRIKSLLGTSLRFNQIKATEFYNNTLTIIKINGNKIQFDLTDFPKSDSKKLNEIIIKNTFVNTV